MSNPEQSNRILDHWLIKPVWRTVKVPVLIFYFPAFWMMVVAWRIVGIRTTYKWGNLHLTFIDRPTTTQYTNSRMVMAIFAVSAMIFVLLVEFFSAAPPVP